MSTAQPDGAEQSNSLEQSYRETLRWYPKSWRRKNEDAALGTLLDVAEEQKRNTPDKDELANLKANALAMRLGSLGRIPAAVRDRVVALTFGLGAGIAIVALVSNAIERATLPSLELPYVNIVGPFLGYTFTFFGMWIVALVASLLGWKWVARALVLAGILVSIGLKLWAVGVPLDRASTSTTIVFTAVLALLSLIGNPFRTARGRAWIAVSAASWAAFIGGTLWFQRASEGGVAGGTDWFIGPFSEWIGWLFPLVIILALVLWRTKRTPWAPAILLAEIPIILFALLGWEHPTALVDVATFAIAGILTLIGCYALLRGFGLKIKITRT